MEYNIDQLPNAILDIVKDHENKPLSILYVYDKIKTLCPTVDFSLTKNFNIFLKTCREINKEYDFVQSFELDGRLHLIYSHTKPNYDKIRYEYKYDDYYHGDELAVSQMNKTDKNHTRNIAASLEEYSAVCSDLVRLENELESLRKSYNDVIMKMRENDKMIKNLPTQLHDSNKELDDTLCKLKEKRNEYGRQMFDNTSNNNGFDKTSIARAVLYCFVIGCALWFGT